MTLKRSPMPPRKSPMRRTEFRRTPLPLNGTSGGWGTPWGGVISGGRSSHPRVGGHRFPVDIDKIVKGRSKGWCEAALPGCYGAAAEKHHRITQKMGGRNGTARRRSDRPSNVVHLCTWCHLTVTLRPGVGRRSGLSLRERQEPTAEPVLYRGELSYLDDAGGVHSFETAGP
jgi:hypothetical protein